MNFYNQFVIQQQAQNQEQLQQSASSEGSDETLEKMISAMKQDVLECKEWLYKG